MRARDRLAWLWRSASLAQPAAPSDAYEDKLGWLVQLAYDIGARDERGRLASILNLPASASFPRLALKLALGDVTAAQAAQVLCDAETDARAHLQPAESLSEGMILQ